MKSLFGTLARLHEVLEPSLYVQLGLRSKEALAISDANTIIIDQTVAVDASIPEHVQLFRKSTSEFFLTDAPDVLQMKADLYLLDGTKPFAELATDFRRILPYCDTTTVVAIDNIFPAGRAAEAEPPAGASGAWELFRFLDEAMVGTFHEPIQSDPTGMLLVFAIIPDKDQNEMRSRLKTWDPRAQSFITWKYAIQNARLDDMPTLTSMFRLLRLNRDGGAVLTRQSLGDT